ncbi:MAG: hypothetical protein EXQ52_09265 [Bryobacterales bacterium]|nr:hypothetical protein [Bryobacterales bacterium]
MCPPTARITNWMSPAYNSIANLFYVVALEGCGVNTKSVDTFRPGGFAFTGTGYIESPREPWQIYVTALDLTTGKLRLEYKQVGTRRHGAGVLSTEGGLLFAGDDQGMFTALDAVTGKSLWHYNTGRRISASPMSYSFEGTQYVSIAAGGTIMAYGSLEAER